MNEHWADHLNEINGRELLIISPLMLLTLLVGLWPAWIFTLINKA